jgi:hypothetical protein
MRPRRSVLGNLSAGSPTISQVAGTALSAGTGIATAAAADVSLTIPIIGAAIGVVTLAIEALLNSGCGQSCIITSTWANQVEAQLQQNIAEYFAIPAPRPQSAQTSAVANFMSVWNYLVQQCNVASLGAAGQKCITDRQSGACTWKQTSTSPLLAYPGEPQAGQCWNWWNGYHDPIANDPDVVSDATYTANLSTPSSSTGSTASSSSFSSSTLLLMAGAVLVIFGMMGNKP